MAFDTNTTIQLINLVQVVLHNVGIPNPGTRNQPAFVSPNFMQLSGYTVSLNLSTHFVKTVHTTLISVSSRSTF